MSIPSIPSITHHPPDETVLQYATGTLHPGPSLVVATHLFFCDACRRRASAFEMVGGALIDALPPSDLSPNALSATLARLEAATAGHQDVGAGDDERGTYAPQAPLAHAPHVPRGLRGTPGVTGSSGRAGRPALPMRPALPAGVAWPTPLRHYEIGRWRFLAPGVKWSTIAVPGQRAGHLVILLRAAPETPLPSHGHQGTEYTCVLTGSFADSHGRFAAGDMIEVGEDVDHQPVAGPDGECICLIATDGRLRMHGIVGRLLQPLLGF